MHAKLLQLCLTLCEPVHGILQARILESVVMPLLLRGSFLLRDRTSISLYVCVCVYIYIYIYRERERERERQRQRQRQRVREAGTEREMSTFIKLNKLLIFSLLLNASFL